LIVPVFPIRAPSRIRSGLCFYGPWPVNRNRGNSFTGPQRGSARIRPGQPQLAPQCLSGAGPRCKPSPNVARRSIFRAGRGRSAEPRRNRQRPGVPSGSSSATAFWILFSASATFHQGVSRASFPSRHVKHGGLSGETGGPDDSRHRNLFHLKTPSADRDGVPCLLVQLPPAASPASGRRRARKRCLKCTTAPMDG